MSETAEWRARAEQLVEHGGVPERRAEVVVAIADGLTHTEAAERIGIARPDVAKHVRRYRAERDEAEWLAEHGPEI